MILRHDHDRHTVSLLTDHIDSLFPKYRGKVLEGEVAEAAEEIIRENCKELDIEVIGYKQTFLWKRKLYQRNIDSAA